MRFPIGLSPSPGKLLFVKARHFERQHEAREAFQEALRNYAAAIGSDGEPYRLELVIRRARRLTNDDAPLRDDDKAALAQLSERYWAFRPDGPSHNVTSFGDARRMIQQLFF